MDLIAIGMAMSARDNGHFAQQYAARGFGGARGSSKVVWLSQLW